jgi:hypothetical protein
MKKGIATIGFIMILTVASISSLLVKINLTYATVVCVDKNDNTKVLPCSDPNAIDKGSLTTSQNSSSGFLKNDSNANSLGQTQLFLTLIISGGIVAGTYEWIRYFFNKRREEAVEMAHRKMEYISANMPKYIQLSAFHRGLSNELNCILEDSRHRIGPSLFYICKIQFLYKDIFEKSGGLQLDCLEAEEAIDDLDKKLREEIVKVFGYTSLNIIQALGQESSDYLSFCRKVIDNKWIITLHKEWLSDTSRLNDMSMGSKLHAELMTFEINSVFKLWYKREPELPILDSRMYNHLMKNSPKYFHRLTSIDMGRYYRPLPYHTKMTLIIVLIIALIIFSIALLIRII